MSDESNKKVNDLEKRVNRLENIAWVLGAVAFFLGVGGGSLWSKLSAATDRADSITQSLEDIPGLIKREVTAKLTLATTELDAKSAQITSEIEKLRRADPGWGIAYCTHQEKYGWYEWVVDGAQSGQSGVSRRLEAIRIVLYRKNEPPPTGRCS